MKGGYVLLTALVVLLLAGCLGPPSAGDGLAEAPEVAATPGPRPTPPTEAPIVIALPEGALVDPEAILTLDVIVEDHYGFLQEAVLTLSWPDRPDLFRFGPTAEMKIPIQMYWPHFLLAVEKEGYLTVYQPFEATLSQDMVYELVIRLLPAGDVAHDCPCPGDNAG